MSEGPFTLAVDVGGTGIKATVFDGAGRQLVEPQRNQTQYPCPPQSLVVQIDNLAHQLPTADRLAVGPTPGPRADQDHPQRQPLDPPAVGQQALLRKFHLYLLPLSGTAPWRVLPRGRLPTAQSLPCVERFG